MVAMGRKEGKESIYDALMRTKEDALASRLRTVWDIAEKSILGAQTSDNGHGAGSLHVKTVEQNLSRLIPDEWKGSKVNPTELFILSASSYLHDNGKIDPDTGDHGTTGAEDIVKNWQFYGLTEMQAGLIAKIIWVHTNRDRIYEVDEIRHLGRDEVHLRDLAALFCLADTLDCEYERVLKSAKEGLPKTRFRRQVSAWFLDDRDDNCIRLEAVPKSLADWECLWESLNYIRDHEIVPISNQLKLAGYPSEIKLKTIKDSLGKEKPITKVGELPGLDFYTEYDESLFKGRQEEIEQLWANVLSENQVSLLSGKSGVGKTSLICAGLFQKLKRIEWQVVRCRLSSKEPVSQIVADLWRGLLSSDEAPPKGFIKALEQVAQRHQSTTTLIVLDQFEEVVRAPVETLKDFQLGILQVMARRFPNLRLLISYQTEVHDEVMCFLKSISQYVGHLPTYSLLALSREGAREALDTLFTSVQIGVDPRPLSEGRSVIDVILDDVSAQGQGFYPPFLQIVASTLTNTARLGDKLVTLELYKELGGAAIIIGQFLLNQLSGFGEKRELAENTLKALVGEGGFVRQKSLEELQHETKMDTSVLRDILEELENKRLVRPLLGDQYEVIHPYLARLVDQQLGEEEREMKRLRERLFLKSREFSSTKDFLSVTDLARLYCIRDRITPDKQEARLLMHCCLAEIGPGWYWFRNYTAEECLPFVTEALSHPYERLRKNATEMIAVLKGKDALPELKKMLNDPRSSVREAAVWAIANLRAYEALPELKRMLLDVNWAVKEATIRALGKLQARDASPKIEKLLYDHYWQVRWAAVEVIGQLGDSAKLKEWLKHPHWQIRGPAVKCLSELEGQKSLSWLKGMLHDTDWAVQTQVVRALIKLKDEESLKEIRQMTSHEKGGKAKEAIVEAAVEASVALEGENALPMLRSMLADRDAYKRKAAVKILAQLAGKSSAGLIVRLLQDRYSIVRIAVVEALTKTESKESLKKFFQKLRGENEDVRKALARGIAKLGSDQEAMKLAKIIASLKFGEWGNAANEALVRLDRKLYSPYQSKLKMLIEGAGTPP